MNSFVGFCMTYLVASSLIRESCNNLFFIFRYKDIFILIEFGTYFTSIEIILLIFD